MPNYDFNVYQPNLGEIYGNAMQMKNLQQQNQLNAMKLRDYPKQQEAAAGEADWERRMKVLDIAMKQKSNAAANGILKQSGFGEYDVDVEGKQVKKLTVNTPKGKVTYSGNTEQFNRAMQLLNGDDGTLKKNPAMTHRALTSPEFGIGLEVTSGEAGKEKDTEMLTIYKTADPSQTRRVPVVKGQQYIPPEGYQIGKPSKGMEVEVGPDGTVRASIGGDMSPKTKGNIEEKIIASGEQYERMKGVLAAYKPEFQEFATGLGVAWNELREKAGADLNPEQAQTMTEYNSFKRRALENINLYIKEITGAQMSVQEAARLRRAMPDPGEKWYQGDSPTEFMAKANDLMKYSRAAQARWSYYRNKGFVPDEIAKMINNGEAIGLDELVQKMGN